MEYRLQISTNAQFSGQLTADINVGNNFYCDLSMYGAELLPGTQYYWRVMDSNNVTSPVALIRSGLDTAPFKIEVSNDNFVTKILDQPVADIEYTPSAAFTRDATYEWRVSGGGAMTSIAESFTIKSALTIPANLTAVLQDRRIIRVAWEQVVGATYYRVYYKTHTGGSYDGGTLFRLSQIGSPPSVPPSYFDVTVASLSDPASPYLDLIGGLEGATYWFAVSAQDEDTSTGMAENGTGVIFREMIAVTDVTVSSVNRSMAVTWSPSVDATGYRIYYKTHEGGTYDGAGLKLTEGGTLLGAYVDVMFSDFADPYHPSVNFWGGTFGTMYYFAVSPIDGGGLVGPMTEAAFGFQLLLIPPMSVNATYVDGYFQITWTRDPLDVLSNSFLVYYKTNYSSPVYNGTGLKLDSPTGADAPSPILIDNATVESLKLYGGPTDVPYWFAVATRDAGGNTSGIIPAPKNVTGFGGQLPEALARGPSSVDVTYDQRTGQMNVTWTPIE